MIVEAGTSIDNAIRNALAECLLTNKPVTFEFNGLTLTVTDDSSFDSVALDFQAQHLARQIAADSCGCEEFQNANQSGTDNEAWGRLIRKDDRGWTIGCDLHPIIYCPWCGKKLP